MEKIKFEEIELTEAEIKELENLQKNMARGGLFVCRKAP